MANRRATYSLQSIRAAVERGAYWISRAAADGAMALDMDEEDVKGCVLSLRPADLYKTMPSKKRPGLFQDVYRCRFQRHPVYIKLQLNASSEAVVISFKRDESAP